MIFGFAECEIFSLLRKCEIRFAYEIFVFDECEIFSYSSENENVWRRIEIREQPWRKANAFRTVYGYGFTCDPRRDRIILRGARASCTACATFQETNRVGFVESHGKAMRREAR